MKHIGSLMAFGAMALMLFVMAGTATAASTGSVTTDTTIVTTTSSRPPRSP